MLDQTRSSYPGLTSPLVAGLGSAWSSGGGGGREGEGVGKGVVKRCPKRRKGGGGGGRGGGCQKMLKKGGKGGGGGGVKERWLSKDAQNGRKGTSVMLCCPFPFAVKLKS